MTGTIPIKEIERKLEALIKDDPGVFLVEVKIKPSNNIKIFVDGDQGVSIDKLVRYNRRLYRQLEEENPSGDFSLEVSSPGLDEPLKLHRQYVKNIGRFVEVTENDGAKKEGKMISADEKEIVLETITGKGKKMETVQHSISFDNIKTTIIRPKI